jgi:hypothetical protein
MDFVNGHAAVGNLKVFVTNGRTKTADEWASEIMEKLMHVAENAPAPLRDQAVAFRDKIYVLIRDNIELALKQEREWILSQR